MSVRKVNIVSVELDEPLHVAGFRHVQTSVRPRLGAYAIGATIYEAFAKVSGPDGIFPRDSAVGYWHGEGMGAAVEDDPVVVRREPESAGRRPVINALSIPVQDRDPDAPAGFRERTANLGPLMQAERVGVTVVELDEGEGSEPYHYQYGREEWVLVLTGTPTLRHAAGTEVLADGDLVCFPDGPAGAHRLINPGNGVTRVVFFSTLGLPANVHYPDSGKWLLRNGSDAQAVMLRDGGPVGYWDTEA